MMDSKKEAKKINLDNQTEQGRRWIEFLQKTGPIIPQGTDWLTENLPQTTGPRVGRPGSEYGVDV